MNTVLDLNDRGKLRSVIQWLGIVRGSGNLRLVEFSEADAQSLRLVLGILKRNSIRSSLSKTFDASWHQYSAIWGQTTRIVLVINSNKHLRASLPTAQPK